MNVFLIWIFVCACMGLLGWFWLIYLIKLVLNDEALQERLRRIERMREEKRRAEEDRLRRKREEQQSIQQGVEETLHSAATQLTGETPPADET